MKIIMFFILTGFIFWTVPAHANLTLIKAYQGAFPDASKPKCIDCHVDKMPKKDGSHDNNDYGNAVKAVVIKAAGGKAPTIDADKDAYIAAYKDGFNKVGKIEDFKK
jgi:hypothetical protein